MNMIIYYTKSSFKQQLCIMKLVLLVLMIMMPTMANADAIEGIYMTNPDSYYRLNGRNHYFENSYEIMIISNDDGSYYVDDLFGGWYCQHLGYGADYAMSGNIEILDDGIVSLKDCYVYSWDTGFSSLKGKYDKASSSFTINEEYDNITFLLTWIKVGEVFKKDGFIYKKEDDNSVSVIKKEDDNKGNIVIPSEVLFNGITYSVTSIDRAFYNCQDIESITIPNSVLSVGDFCFSHCKNLKSVTISNGLNSIGDSSFFDCNNLTSIFIPNSVTSIGRSAFYNCTSLTTVNIPQNVSVIEDDSFYGCMNLTSLTISNGVNKIEYEAFTGCTSLTTLFIPQSLTYINNAFYDCIGLTSIIVDSENEVFDSRDNCNAIIETNTNTLILGCKNTKIPNSVSDIGALAFCGCSGLTSLNIPNSVKTIGNDSFYGCINLTSVFIPQSVISIDGYAFDKCI